MPSRCSTTSAAAAAEGRTRARERGSFWFVRPQADFLGDDGARLVEHVVRLEDLDAALPEIRRRSGLASEIGHVNRSRVRVRQNDLEPIHLRTIERLYRADFELLGYPAPGDAGPWPETIDAEERARRGKAEMVEATWGRARTAIRRAWKRARRR